MKWFRTSLAPRFGLMAGAHRSMVPAQCVPMVPTFFNVKLMP